MTCLRSLRVATLALACVGASAGGVAHAQDTDACISASEASLGLRKAGKLIEARAALSSCAAASCPDTVRTSCAQRLGDVGQAIPSIIFFAKDSVGHDVAAVSLAIDGKPYTDHLDGTAIVLDPGEHEFRFQAAGHAPVVQRLVLHQAEQDRRETVVVIEAPPPPVDHGQTRRLAGLIVGGVGVAGLITGAIFGGATFAEKSSYMGQCGSNIDAPPGRCNAAGVGGESTASTYGTVSTVAFIVGGLAVAGGAVLYFTAPRPPRGGSSSASLGVGPGGLSLAGSF